MSPTLFSLYTDQLEHHLQSHDQDAPKLLDTKVSISLYADDIVHLHFKGPLSNALRASQRYPLLTTEVTPSHEAPMRRGVFRTSSGKDGS